MNFGIHAGRAASFAAAFAAAVSFTPVSPVLAQEQEDAAAAATAREQEYHDLRAALEAASDDLRALPAPAGSLAVPEIFSGSVRGCTQDGKVYHVEYSMSIDTGDLAGSDGSLLARTVTMDPERVQGVSGADSFMNALNDITRSLDHSMQSVVGPMIDSVFSGFIQGPEFALTLDRAAAEIGRNVGEPYGVGISVLVEQPRQQTAAPCGVATQPVPAAEPHAGMR